MTVEGSIFQGHREGNSLSRSQQSSKDVQQIDLLTAARAETQGPQTWKPHRTQGRHRDQSHFLGAVGQTEGSL